MFKKMFKISAIILLFLWIGFYGVFVANITVQFTPPSNESLEKADAIVVLTGGHNRIQTGLSLFSSGLSENLFITGVHTSVNKGDITAVWKEKKALPDCCITLGHKATTTLENALETKEWVALHNIKSIHLVTSTYHMNRALLEFNHALTDVSIIPYPVMHKGAQELNFRFWKISFSEYNKILFRAVIIALTNKG